MPKAKKEQTILTRKGTLRWRQKDVQDKEGTVWKDYPEPYIGRTGLEKLAVSVAKKTAKIKKRIAATGPYAPLKLDGPARVPPLDKSKFIEVRLHRKRKA